MIMDLQQKNILFACCYEAQYGGNFIKMLISLGNTLKIKFNAKVFFLFPKQIEKKWLVELKEHFQIGYTCKPYSKSTNDILAKIIEWDIDIVHTHFEGYDIPVAKAIRKSGREVKMVWHLHDYISFDKTGLRFKFLRKVGTNLRLWLQYGWYGRKAYFIGVSAEVTNIACHYRSHIFSLPKIYSNDELLKLKFSKADVVLNGIDMSRLKDKYNPKNKIFTFLSFGGESYSKGIPCILKAARILANRKCHFNVLLTCGYTTQKLLDEVYKGILPEWLKVINQTDDICSLFNQANCYISASLKETMSMGIAEASIYGLPVIQSDIPGTYWNAGNESTYLFRVNDVISLANQMEKVMNEDVDQLNEKCEASKNNNCSLLSMDKWVNSIIYIYRNI